MFFGLFENTLEAASSHLLARVTGSDLNYTLFGYTLGAA